jgi:hypothetical protein
MGANQLAAPAVVASVITLLKADPTLAALLSVSPVDGGAAVYEGVAPQGAPYDYLIVADGGEVPANALRRGWGAAVLVYLRGVSRQMATAKAIVSRAVALLDYPETPFTVTGYVSAVGELVSGGPGYPEEVRGELIHHHPAVVRATVQGIEDAGSPA